MGTRADFYIGRGLEAEWIGSVAFDAYPGAEYIKAVCASVSGPDDFRASVQALEHRRDFTDPAKHGWPWPWKDSGTTDYAYAFAEGRVWVSGFGRPWYAFDEGAPSEELEGDEEDESKVPMPDMSARRELAIGTDRDSIIVLGVRKS